MANWKYKLNLKHFYHNDSYSIEEKGKLLAMQIRKLPLDKIEYYCGDDLEDVADLFEGITGCDEFSPQDEFNEYMGQLYEMADRYEIWIETK